MRSVASLGRFIFLKDMREIFAIPLVWPKQDFAPLQKLVAFAIRLALSRDLLKSFRLKMKMIIRSI